MIIYISTYQKLIIQDDIKKNSIYKTIKKNKILRHKLHKGGSRLTQEKQQNIIERNF